MIDPIIRQLEASRRAREIVALSPSPALVTDPCNRVTACNDRLCTLRGRTADSMLGASLEVVLEPTDIFGNRLDPGLGGLHAMVRRFEAIQSFKLCLCGSRHAVGLRARTLGGLGTGCQPGSW